MWNNQEAGAKTKAGTLLSVAMVTYNHGKYIRQALDSILMQRVSFDYEIIVGEDCSPDDTRQIVIEYAQKYPDKIKLILQKHNKGPNENSKDVIRRCRGKYIAFLEGDDYWSDPDKLQIQIDYMEGHPEVSCTYHRVNVINAKNEIINHEHNQKQGNIFDLEQLFQSGWLVTCSVIIRNYFIGNDYLKYLKSKYVGDLIVHSLSLKHGPIHFLDRNMGVYRLIRNEGTSFSALSPPVMTKNILVAFISIVEIADKRYRGQLIEKEIMNRMFWLYCGGQKRICFQIYIKHFNIPEKVIFAKYLKDIRYLMNKDTASIKQGYWVYFMLINTINIKIIENAIKNEDKVIIYGTGDWGCRLYRVLSRKRINILAFSDSNKEKWDKHIHGLKVISPRGIENTEYSRIFIASSAYIEIKKSLLQIGIEEKKIILFCFMGK